MSDEQSSKPNLFETPVEQIGRKFKPPPGWGPFNRDVSPYNDDRPPIVRDTPGFWPHTILDNRDKRFWDFRRRLKALGVKRNLTEDPEFDNREREFEKMECREGRLIDIEPYYATESNTTTLAPVCFDELDATDTSRELLEDVRLHTSLSSSERESGGNYRDFSDSIRRESRNRSSSGRSLTNGNVSWNRSRSMENPGNGRRRGECSSLDLELSGRLNRLFHTASRGMQTETRTSMADDAPVPSFDVPRSVNAWLVQDAMRNLRLVFAKARDKEEELNAVKASLEGMQMEIREIQAAYKNCYKEYVGMQAQDYYIAYHPRHKEISCSLLKRNIADPIVPTVEFLVEEESGSVYMTPAMEKVMEGLTRVFYQILNMDKTSVNLKMKSMALMQRLPMIKEEFDNLKKFVVSKRSALKKVDISDIDIPRGECDCRDCAKAASCEQQRRQQQRSSIPPTTRAAVKEIRADVERMEASLNDTQGSSGSLNDTQGSSGSLNDTRGGAASGSADSTPNQTLADETMDYPSSLDDSTESGRNHQGGSENGPNPRNGSIDELTRLQNELEQLKRKLNMLESLALGEIEDLKKKIAYLEKEVIKLKRSASNVVADAHADPN